MLFRRLLTAGSNISLRPPSRLGGISWRRQLQTKPLWNGSFRLFGRSRQFRPPGLFKQLGSFRTTPFLRTFSTEGSWFGNKLRVLLMRRRKSWSRDDVWALVSWLFVGQGLFILVGTTTFASLVLLLANSLQFQDWLARRLTKYLAKHTGLDVSFGETIVPNWRTGRISFKDVAVKSITSERGATVHNDSGHTIYDLVIERAEVTLSMKRLLEGKGLILSCDISGVRGVVNRSGAGSSSSSHNGWRYVAQRGDFDLHQVTLRDVLVTIRNQSGFRPYNLSIISAEIPRLRKRFILYDMLAAESVVGMLDGSLFSMHIPQVLRDGSTDQERCTQMRHLKMHALNVDFLATGAPAGPLSWLTRGSVDVDVFIQLPLNYRHPSESDSLSDRIGALTEGLLVQVLRESGNTEQSNRSESTFKKTTFESLNNNDNGDGDGNGDERFNQVEQDIRKKFKEMSASLFGPFLQRLQSRIRGDILNVDDRALEAPEQAAVHFLHAKPDTVTFKVDFCFHNLRAHLPWRPTEQSLISATLMRPLVAYINEQRPFIPLSCNFDISLNQLDGAWSIYESGIVDSMSRGAALSFELLVSDRQKKIRRLKRVSLWSLYAIFRNIRNWMVDTGYYYYPVIINKV